jgi:hypothetical protein
LQRRELGVHPGLNNSNPVLPAVQQHTYPQPNGYKVTQPGLKQQPSVTFRSTSPVQSPVTTPRGGSSVHAPSPERRQLGRRNTIQGIKQEGTDARLAHRLKMPTCSPETQIL